MEIWRQRARRASASLRSFALVGVGIASALIAMFIFSVLNPGPPRLTKQDVNNVVASAMASATPRPPAAVGVYEVIAPSIVHIATRFMSDAGTVEHGRGTGVVLDQRGTILTSLHVVRSSLETKVTFADGTQSAAVQIAAQQEKDIAVLRTIQPPAGLVPATLGNPRLMRPGDEAVVVGDPFGLSNTVTVGAISGLDRIFNPPNGGPAMTGLIQFDAAVNPGNSGGPLLNSAGEVIGIVTGLVNPTKEDVFIGIGFAVPIDTAASAAGSPPY
jgi:S1-C subfamily serine protease